MNYAQGALFVFDFFSAVMQLTTDKRVSQMRAPLAARHQPEGDQNRPPKVPRVS